MNKTIMDYDALIKKSFTFYLFVITIALLFFPWGFIFPSLVGGGVFFEYRGLSYVLILFLLLVFLFENSQFKSKRTGFYLPILLISAGVALSLIPHTNIAATSEMAIYLCSAVGLGFLANHFGYVEEHRKTIAFILLIIMLGLALYGIYQYFIVFPALKESSPSIGRLFDFRLTSVLTNPTAYASLIIMTWPIALLLLVEERKSLMRLFYGLTILIFFLTLLLTFSKSAFAAAVFQFILMIRFFYQEKRESLKKFMVPFLITLAAGLIISLPVLAANQQRVSGYLTNLQISFAGRVSLWKTAMHMFLSYPLTGVGGFAFKDVFFSYQADGFYSSNAHSTFIQLFAETGIFGGTGFLMLALYLFLRCCFYNKKISLSKFIGFGTTGFLLMNTVDSLLYYLLVGYYFAVTVGLAYSEIDKPIMVHRDFPRNAFIILFLFFLVLSILVNIAHYSYLAGKAQLLNNYKDGIKYLRTAANLFPIEAEYHRSLAQACSIGAFSNKSYRLLRIIEMKRANFLQPYNPRYYFELGYFYETENQPKLAAYFYKKALKYAPKQPFYYYQLGRLYYEGLNGDLARKYLLQAVALNIYYKPAYVKQSYEPGKGKNEYDPYYSIAKAALLLGNLELSSQKKDKAIEYYTIALKWYPELAEAYAARASAYIRKGEYRSAVMDAEKAIKIQPEEADFYYLAAAGYYNMNKHDIALLYLEEALKIDPHNNAYIELYEKIRRKLNDEGNRN